MTNKKLEPQRRKERKGFLGFLASFAPSRFIIAVAIGILAALLPAPARAGELPPSASIEGVVGHPQEHNLSCESRTSSDLAAFWGVAFTEDDFFRRLPKSDNPFRGFLGDVDLPAGTMPPYGYGVYAGPVAATLRSLGLDARTRSGWSLDELQAEIAAGRPVAIWATYDMRLPGTQTWTSSDGATSVVVQWQHTFIAVGYDETGVLLIDAYDAGTKHFTYEAFLPAWEQLGSMAVTVVGPLTRPARREWQAGAHNRLVVDDRWDAGPY